MWILRTGKLERSDWYPIVGDNINNPIASNYQIVKNNNSLSMIMYGTEAYSGWLAKHVEPLLYQVDDVLFKYTLMIDECTVVNGQVVETDSKITDNEQWTYDLSAQWNITNDWMFQVDDDNWQWVDTGVRLPKPNTYEQQKIAIEYKLDYANKQSIILAFWNNGERYALPNPYWIQARQIGWKASEIVTQLQQCNNHAPGGYTLWFRDIGYELNLS